MAAAKKKPGQKRAPAKRKKKKKGGGRSIWPMLIAVVVPCLLVGGYLLYQTNGAFTGVVDETSGKVKGLVGNLLEGHEKESADHITTPDANPAMTRHITTPDANPAMTRHNSTPDANPAMTRRPADIPRQQKPVAAQGSMTPITVKQAQAAALAVFGGTIVNSKATAKAFWYDFELEGGKKRYPFDIKPRQVSVSTVALQSTFLAGRTGFVAFIRSQDPQAGQWVNEYAGAVLFSGTPSQPGSFQGATAMQAPSGLVTRYEAIDVQGDGTAELVLEVESEAPGGYLFRDLAIHAFNSGGTRVLWNVRTLDDGPGVPTETARFKNISFVDDDSDGILSINVDVGKRIYRVNKDFTRSLKTEKVIAHKTFRLSRGKYRLAGS
jgi:hypothetical protein